MRRALILGILVLAFLGIVLTLMWPSPFPAPKISVATVGFTNISGVTKFVVAVTNNSRYSIDCLVGQASGTWRGQTGLAQEQRVFLRSNSGTLVAVPMSLPTNAMAIAVFHCRRRGHVQEMVRLVRGRLGLSPLVSEWEELPVIKVGNCPEPVSERL